jgi:hypothetical protein
MVPTSLVVAPLSPRTARGSHGDDDSSAEPRCGRNVNRGLAVEWNDMYPTWYCIERVKSYVWWFVASKTCDRGVRFGDGSMIANTPVPASKRQ